MSDKEKNVDTKELLASIKKTTGTADTPKAPEVPQAKQPQNVEVAEYQQYSSSRISTCLITPNGKRINFTNYQYYTKDPEIMDYLDVEIANGVTGFTKGKKLTASELNPEAAKKRQIIEEFKASQEGRDFGNTKSKEQQSNALHSGQVAN